MSNGTKGWAHQQVTMINTKEKKCSNFLVWVLKLVYVRCDKQWQRPRYGAWVNMFLDHNYIYSKSPTKWRPREVGEKKKMWENLRLRTLLKEGPCKGGAKSEPLI